MKNNPLLMVIAGLVALLCSCKIQEDIYFKKNMSGSMQYTLDMGGMRGFSAQMKDVRFDTLAAPKNPFEMLDTLNIDLAASEFNRLEGVSNAVIKRNSGEIKISFDFKDLNALNRAYSKIVASGDLLSMNGGSSGGFKLGEVPEKEAEPTFVPYHAYFTQKGKTLKFTPTKKSTDKDAKVDMEKALSEASQMGFEYRMKISFERKVKSLKAKEIEAEQQENDIIIKKNPKNLPAQAELSIKLK